MANRAEYDRGYQEAIEAIKKALSGQQPQGNNQPSTPDGRDMDLGDTEAGEKMQSNGGNGNLPDQQNQSGQGQQNGSNSGRGSGDEGVVTPEDCAGQYGDNTPETPGGFMDISEGNKLAKEEGYDEGPSTDALSNQWKNIAQQAAKQKSHGTGAGKFVEKVNALWNTHHDWKKTLKKIIGRSLNTQDKRQAYANKNVLISQDRIARTDKDKWDAVDYMCMFVDSSGSMSNDELSIAASEVYNIALALKPITMVYGTFDTKVNDIQVFNNPNEFKSYVSTHGVKGRGGTEASCVWKLLRDDKNFKRRRAELVVVVSDGDSSCNSCKRDPKTMENLCWIQFNAPGWQPNSKDAMTTIVHLDSRDIK